MTAGTFWLNHWRFVCSLTPRQLEFICLCFKYSISYEDAHKLADLLRGLRPGGKVRYEKKMAKAWDRIFTQKRDRHNKRALSLWAN